MKKFGISVLIALGLIVLVPKEEARADILTATLIGAGIGAVVGLVYALATMPSGTNGQAVGVTNAGSVTNQAVNVGTNRSDSNKNTWDERR